MTGSEGMRGLRLLAAALVVLLGIWAGIKLHALRAQRQIESAATTVAAGPSALAAQDDVPDAAIPHPVIPARLPAFSLSNLAGTQTPISAWSGKSLLINFWATWCAPCRNEIPLLQSVAAQWAARDLQVIGIAVDHRDQVREFAGHFSISYPLLVGEQDALDAAAKFGMDTPVFPFSVFTDRRGEVVALFVGELHRPQLDLILGEVQSLNQDRVRLEQAQRAIADGLQALKEQPSG